MASNANDLVLPRGWKVIQVREWGIANEEYLDPAVAKYIVVPDSLLPFKDGGVVLETNIYSPHVRVLGLLNEQGEASVWEPNATRTQSWPLPEDEYEYDDNYVYDVTDGGWGENEVQATLDFKTHIIEQSVWGKFNGIEVNSLTVF